MKEPACPLCNCAPSLCGKRPKELSVRRGPAGQQPVGSFLCSCSQPHNGVYGLKCEDCWAVAQRMTHGPAKFLTKDFHDSRQDVDDRCIYSQAGRCEHGTSDCGNCNQGIQVKTLSYMQRVVIGR